MTIILSNGKEITFEGKYIGETRPDGKLTENWHYYKGDDGTIYHFRKPDMIAVIDKGVGHLE